MKTKAKSVHVFEVRLWSKEYYKDTKYKANTSNIYLGLVTDSKTKKKIFVDSAGDLLKAIEKMYKEDEKKE